MAVSPVGHEPARHTKGWLGPSAYLDAAHRVHARLRTSSALARTPARAIPLHDFALNTAWLTATMTAQILLAWLRLLALDGDLARAEPKTLRYRILHAAARLVRGGRRRRLKFQVPGHGLGDHHRVAAHRRAPATP